MLSSMAVVQGFAGFGVYAFIKGGGALIWMVESSVRFTVEAA